MGFLREPVGGRRLIYRATFSGLYVIDHGRHSFDMQGRKR